MSLSEVSNETVRVRKANSIIQVPYSEKDSYLAKGYDIVNDRGAVVESCMPNDVPTLQAKYGELLEENKKLKAEIEALRTAPKKVETVSTEEEKVVEVKPKTKATRSKK